MFGRYEVLAGTICAATLALASICHAGGACGIYVAPTGIDNPTGGLTGDDPVATINYGVQRAFEEGLSCVFVQAGTYNEVVTLASGINIDGGYDTAWARDSYTEREHTVQIVGGLHAGTGHYMTIRAVSLNAVTQVSNLVIFGPHASGASKSSYAVYTSSSNRLVLHQVRINAGNGADGIPGAAGTDGPAFHPSLNGSPGGSGGIIGGCNDSAQGAGGLPGVTPIVFQRWVEWAAPVVPRIPNVVFRLIFLPTLANPVSPALERAADSASADHRDRCAGTVSMDNLG